MAFTFAGSVDSDYMATRVYGLLGIDSDDSLMPSSDMEENLVLIQDTEKIINDLVADYDSKDDTGKTQVLNAGCKILAGKIYMYVMPNALPKYMSDNKAVFDKFRNIDYAEIGASLISEGKNELNELEGVTSESQFLISSPATDVITGE